MLSLDEWAAVGIVAGAIIAILGVPVALVAVSRLAFKGIRRMVRAFKKFGVLMDQLLGDAEHPSLMQVLEDTRATGQATLTRVERVEEGLARVEAAQADHLEQWHGAGAGAGPVPVQIQRGRRR